MLLVIWGFSLRLSHAKLCTKTVTDDEGLLHVSQEMEAKVTAPFAPERLDFSFTLFAGVVLLVYFLFWVSINGFGRTQYGEGHYNFRFFDLL